MILSSGGYASPTSSPPGRRTPSPPTVLRLVRARRVDRIGSEPNRRQTVTDGRNENGGKRWTADEREAGGQTCVYQGGRTSLGRRHSGRNAFPLSLILILIPQLALAPSLSHCARTHACLALCRFTLRARYALFCFFCYTSTHFLPIVSACTEPSFSPLSSYPSTS